MIVLHESIGCRFRMLLIAAVLIVSGSLSDCAARRQARGDYGILQCPAGAGVDLLSPDALQCWFRAPHGRWRILSHESHYDVLVVQVEAASVGDAGEIARRFVTGESRTFSEILVYTRLEVPDRSSQVRRVRWTRSSGLETLEFHDTRGSEAGVEALTP